MNAALLGSIGAGVASAGATVGRALASRVGGTNQMPSARSQYSLDGAISRLGGIVKENTDRSQAMADAANAFTKSQADQAMEFSAREAAKNRDWQKMMSDTAHQREVKDLQAAGLNPVLSAMGGNGAAVTSGATASSSAGSGQKGEVDTSLSHGMVSLLGSMLSAQTQLAQTAMSARSNEAIADKTTAMQRLVAEITGQYGLAREELSGEYGLKRQYMSDTYANYRTGLTSAATRYAADRAAAASMYGSDMRYAIARDFPNSPIAALASVLGELLGGDGSGLSGAVSGGKQFAGKVFEFGSRNSQKEQARYDDFWKKYGEWFTSRKDW